MLGKRVSRIISSLRKITHRQLNSSNGKRPLPSSKLTNMTCFPRISIKLSKTTTPFSLITVPSPLSWVSPTVPSSLPSSQGLTDTPSSSVNNGQNPSFLPWKPTKNPTNKKTQTTTPKPVNGNVKPNQPLWSLHNQRENSKCPKDLKK